MGTLVTLKEKLLAARKKGEKKATAFFALTIAEIEKVGKNAGNRETSEAEAVKAVQKIIKGIAETNKHINQETEAARDLRWEKSQLDEFAPSLASEEATREFILEKCAGLPIGPTMGKLKAEFGEAANLQAGAKIIKELYS